MGKSDDSIMRRRNKKSNKKQQDKAKVSTRIASIIASKKRRLAGKRRMCQGMCFSLPTPEDPFNDRHGKTDIMKKRKTCADNKAGRKPVQKNCVRLRKASKDDIDLDGNAQEQLVTNSKKVENKKSFVSSFGLENAVVLGKDVVQMTDGCPSNFLIVCLKSIQAALHSDKSYDYNGDCESLLCNPWGIEFWNCYSNGKDVVETSGGDVTIEQIAWVASTVADTIARNEIEGKPFTDPSVLFIVPSQEKAATVRRVCKPLITFGIHTVSLHSGASIDHQIQGLKVCEPEFVVSTSERLLELISLKAIDISGVSLLVVDGLGSHGRYLDEIESIMQSFSRKPQIIIFSDISNNPSISVVLKLLKGS